MGKLWKKSDTELHPVIEKYSVGTDYIFDVELLPFDIIGSKAHAKSLEKAGVLTEKELEQLLAALNEVENDVQAGKIHIRPEDEDCHTVIENYLVEKTGDAGKKIH